MNMAWQQLAGTVSAVVATKTTSADAGTGVFQNRNWQLDQTEESPTQDMHIRNVYLEGIVKLDWDVAEDFLLVMTEADKNS